MKYIATFDFGTTAVKGALVDTAGKLAAFDSVNLSLDLQNGHVEQDPKEWIRAFEKISKVFFSVATPENIAGLIMSGQMQDVILMDDHLWPMGRAILYQDGRSRKEYEALLSVLEEAELERITGNAYSPTLVLPKLAWVKENQPELWQKARCVLHSPKDVINALLTGRCCTDTTTASTAGAMDIHRKIWNPTILETAGIPLSYMPQICAPHECIGGVTKAAAAQFGYAEGMPVFCGIGDAGASFFASGLIHDGEFSITLGTTGMIGLIARETIPPQNGIWNLAAMVEDTYIHVVPFLNAGNVHKWVSSLMSADFETIDYAYMNKLLDEPHGQSGLVCLPFLIGERFPVVDPDVRGCLIGLTPSTTRADIANACLEGVCFSIKQGLDTIAVPPRKVVLIGGGARAIQWCQKMADILEVEITVLSHSDVLPSIALAGGALRSLGLIDDYASFIQQIQEQNGSTIYKPQSTLQDYYRRCYQTYLQIYPSVRNLF